MKYSIKKQLAITFIGLMSATILLCWFINSTFLSRLYIVNKMKALKNAYTVVNRAFSTGNVMTEEFDIQLQKIIETDNISLIVLDTDSRMLITSRNDQEIMSQRLWDNFFNEFEAESGNMILEEGDNYTIQQITDPRMLTEYIEIWGIFDNGNIFLFQTALEGIRDSVAIANRLLAYIGIAAVLISGMIIMRVSGRITEPILELTEISERMARLDFDAKYCGNSRTEIALLGNNINELSYTLPCEPGPFC